MSPAPRAALAPAAAEVARTGARGSRALAASPAFILLDEPFAGIDPLAVLDIQKIIAHLRDRGIGILITDHNVRETLSITDRAYILRDGNVFRSGTPHELASDPEVADPNVRQIPTATPTEGVGCVEAPRGTLTHHYWTDERGILTRVNLVVGTTNNYAPIALSVKKAAQSLIHKGTVVTDGLLDRVEMAFRAYDPCFGCATHALPGQMPLEVTVRGADGEVVERLARGVR